MNDEKKWAEFTQIMGYTGPNTVIGCTKFIEEKLLALNNNLKDKHEDQMDIKIHITNALDTPLMSKIATDIKTSILSYTFNDIGLI